MITAQMFANKIVPLKCEFQIESCKLQDQFIKIPNQGFVKISENVPMVESWIAKRDRQIQNLAKKFRYHVCFYVEYFFHNLHP